MFKNVGAQIKTIAKAIVAICTIVGLIEGGILYLLFSRTTGPSALLCIMWLLFFGCIGLVSGYFSSIFMYAYGELVDDVQKIKETIVRNEVQNYKTEAQTTETVKEVSNETSKKESWECIYCGYKNYGKFSKCEFCGLPGNLYEEEN